MLLSKHRSVVFPIYYSNMIILLSGPQNGNMIYRSVKVEFRLFEDWLRGVRLYLTSIEDSFV